MSYRRHDYDPQYSGQQASSLAGNLSLIIALAAFSAPQNYMVQVIGSCFKPPYWYPHNSPENRQHMRGMVVSIHLDPSTAITREGLKQFEDGYYGPIIV
ncbi:hypothetical protein FQN54_005358 [Arachnomyces sp. PD_36]|nr:hypothetical protein FQN54_005358 [Arachnomyces sp. PD_36]